MPHSLLPAEPQVRRLAFSTIINTLVRVLGKPVRYLSRDREGRGCL